MRTLLALVAMGICLSAVNWNTRADVANNAKNEQDAAAKEAAKQENLEKDVTQGALRIEQADGQIVECPLKHTDVAADVAGFIARVKVTQTFYNPTKDKIEAVYVFPLPHEAAVDDMTMVVGDRKIQGTIKKRTEARLIYQQALAQGQTAALLEQERPNIFTQSVGNIGPGQEVKIEISYVDVLRYDMGQYEFHFPMVVGPRYNPGAPIASPAATPPELTGKVSPPEPDTTRVPDASRISPPVLKPDVRNGHDVMVRVKLDAGVPIQELHSTNHQVEIARDGDRRAKIELVGGDTIPNKDFVLRYDVVGEKPEMALLAHTGKYSGDARNLGDGYFMLMIQPKEDERLTKSPPREIVFLVDVSGSMSGEPIAKASECMREMAKICRPEQDTLQVISFAGDTTKLFEKPQPANATNIGQAVQFALAMKGGGGTEMLKGVKAAIDEPLDKERVRIVVMLTDGYIGNEAEIIGHVGKNCGDQVRFWCVGIGQAPNMFLVDGVAKQGGGMGKKLGLRDDATALAQEVMTRIQRAQLAKVKIDWGGLHVAETYPAKLPELWAGRPVIVYGRYQGAGDAAINVSGVVEGEPVSWPLQVKLPASETSHNVLAKVWARKKIEDLMQQSFYAGSPEVEEVVTALALDYKLMSQYTSFVAVDSQNTTETSEPAVPPRRMMVPVPLPEGTRWEGFFGPLGDSPAEEKELALGLTVDFYAKKDAPARHYYANGRMGGGGRGGAIGSAGGYGGFNFGATPMDGGSAVTRFRRESLRKFSISEARQNLGYVPALQPASRPAAAAGAVSGPTQLSAGISRGRIEAQGLGRLAMPVSEGLAKAVDRELDDKLSESREEQFGQATGYTLQSLAGDAPGAVKSATEALAAAKEAEKGNKLDTAREQFTRAFFLDQAAANVGASGGGVATESLAALAALHAKQVNAWTKESPVLAKKLDLVLRDVSLEEAIRRVAKAAGLKAHVLPGSLDDAAALAGESESRISFLDLRRATAAQALDWLLLPEHLSWWKSSEGVAIGSDRRRAGNSAWVYDVSLIALPDATELAKLGDIQKAIAAAKQEADRFTTVVQGELGKSASVTWFAPGQLLIVGTSRQHDVAAKLLAGLTDAKVKLQGAAAELDRVTSKRFAERKANADRIAKVRKLIAVAGAHERFGWQLLAAAAAGKVDPEALTELQIAWRQPETAELLKGEGRAVALRSWWIASEAAGAIDGGNAELAALVKTAGDVCEPAVRAATAALRKETSNRDAFSAVLYAALAMHDKAYTKEVFGLLTQSAAADDPLSPARTIAAGLLTDPGKLETPPLEKLVEGGVAGNDLTVLLAMACRRAGSDTWSAFRAASADLAGGQPLDGNVVVLLNRLSAAPFATTARR